MVALAAFAANLSGCGHPKTFDSLDVVSRGPVQTRTQNLSVVAAADEALLTQQAITFVAVGIQTKNNQSSVIPTGASSVVPPLDLTTVPAATSSPWDCIAEAETGSDYTMHGSTYSTAFGIVNDIIYDYGTPEEQRAVFSGTASKETQIAIASRFANEHGFGGWGELTKQKCGL